MDRAGEVQSIAQSVAIMRTPGETHPDIGKNLLDESLDSVGRVVDVFGPIERPYLAISPAEDVHPPSLVGRPLYYR